MKGHAGLIDDKELTRRRSLALPALAGLIFIASCLPLASRAAPESHAAGSADSKAASSLSAPPQQNPVPRRSVRVKEGSFASGQPGTLVIELESLGNENAFGFSLNFNPVALAFTEAKLASGVNALILVNSRHAGEGRIGIALALSAGQTFEAGRKALVEIGFKPQPGTQGVATKLSFGDQPIFREMVGSLAQVLPGDFAGGTVRIIDPANPDAARPPPFKLGPVAPSLQQPFRLRLAGELGEQYVIEASSDFVTWTRLRTVTMEGNVSEALDEEAANFPGRFYRAVLRPQGGAQ